MSTQSVPISLPQLVAQHATQTASINLDAAPPFEKLEGRVLSTLNPDGSRRWLSPKLSTGRFWQRRRIVAWALIILFAAMPWVRINGLPPILLDLMTRQFVFFGTVFRPTDTLLLALLILSVFIGIFLATALFGRVWCGWACPQTVYMEFVYRPIERLFLGRGYGNPKVAVAAWRRVAMYAVFLVVSAHLANTFLAYFVGTDRLVEWTFGSPFAHWTAFLVVAVTTGLMMFDFCFYREQLCTLVCPYGRFQSVLLDRDSLVVGYDRIRGEPRGRKRGESPAKSGKRGCDHDAATGSCKGGCGCGGADLKDETHSLPQAVSVAAPSIAPERTADCIDCTLCVQTCPTGIDIRDGVQLECIHCAQCIDACDAVMDKLQRPRGLIRYSSQNRLDRTHRRGMRLRVVFYPLLLTLVVTAFVVLLISRKDAMVVQLRTQGTPYLVADDGAITNLLRIRVDNRTSESRTYRVEGIEGTVLREPVEIAIDPSASSEADVHVFSRAEDFARGRREVHLRVSDGKSYDEVHVFSIVGPFAGLGGRGGASTEDDESDDDKDRASPATGREDER